MDAYPVESNFNNDPTNPRRIIVTINMGCKAPVACYNNKKQNFLVRSSQQCFPGMAITSVCRQCCHENGCNENLDPTTETTWTIDHPGSEDFIDLYFSDEGL